MAHASTDAGAASAPDKYIERFDRIQKQAASEPPPISVLVIVIGGLAVVAIAVHFVRKTAIFRSLS
jgi:hypothetical protein